jgi:hypothetical protein
MRPLYEDPHFMFRFADERIIPRFHLDGVPAGQPVSVFRINAETGERQDLLAMAIVGDDGWVDLGEPCGPVRRSLPNWGEQANRRT